MTMTEQLSKAYAVAETQEGPAAWITLDRIAELVDMTPAQIGQAAVELTRAGMMELAPFTGRERSEMIAVRFGGEDQHMIARA